MTTGAPLYLVSACASAEEFVAAFRRYADRAGLFVPIADPLPQGRRGRIAVTLNDGRIVLEGEVEVATSSTRPSPLYGRVGMTLKFVEPDAATKTTLLELEKARLAMKPPPLSVAPRSPGADVPAQPRPTPPPIGGRIDAANALAETVALGEVAAWREGAAPKPASDSPSNKFVIPTIPQVGAPRSRTPSVPPALQPKLALDPKPPPLPGTTPVAIPAKVVAPSIAVSSKATSMGMPAIDRLPGVELVAEVKPKVATPPKGTSMGMPAIDRLPGVELISDAPPKGTSMGMPALRAPSEGVASTPPRRDPTPIPKRGDSIVTPTKQASKQTTLGMPIVRAPADHEKTNLGPITIEAPSPPPPTSTGAARRAHTPSTPPTPRHPTPYTPLPIVRKPASELPSNLDLSEPTERTSIPEPPPVGEEQKKTSLGVSMMSASPVETGWDESGPAYVGPPPTETSGRSGGLRASEIMTAMKGEDWVMTPDASQPTIVPKSEPELDPNVKAAEEKSGPAVGDWAISLDPQAPGGWSAPAKVEKLPEPKQNPASGNRNIAVASSKAIEAVEWEEKPTGIGEALVEIDPTLMGPPIDPPELPELPELPDLPDLPDLSEDEEPVNIVSMPAMDIPPPLPLPPPPSFALNTLPLAAKATTPPPVFAPFTPAPPPRPAASDLFPAFAPHVQDPTDSIKDKTKRRVVMLAIAAAVAVIATMIVISFTGGKKPHADHARGGSGSAVAIAVTAVDAAIVVPDQGSAQEVTTVDAGVAAPKVCNVEVTTNPSGADISLDKTTVLGTSPATIQVPCGAETKIYVKKAKFGSAVRAFTATADAAKVAIRIAAPVFQVKVTSSPSGATITIAGKVVGITPTSIRVTAYASTTITLTKDNYVPDSQKIAPRQNSAAHHVVLKRVTKKLR
ncbi:MAG: PEGA domain-containing protein [Kofleriaceae bacterium]